MQSYTLTWFQKLSVSDSCHWCVNKRLDRNKKPCRLKEVLLHVNGTLVYRQQKPKSLLNYIKD